MWNLHKIPKIAHFYWGNDSISYLRFLSIYSFKKFNPDWEIRLYFPVVKYRGVKTWGTPEHSGQFSGLDYMPELLNLPIEKIAVDFTDYGLDNNVPESFKADFLRWHLLATVGGLWSDFDIIYFRPMDHLGLNKAHYKFLDTIVCLREIPGEVYHSIGFLLGAPENRYYQFIFKQIASFINLGNYQSIGSSIPNTYFPSITSIRERFPDLHLANLPMDVVYPIDYTMVPYLFHTGYLHYLSEACIGLHWFAGHPEAGVFENLLNEHTIINYDNIISLVIRKNGMLTCIKH
ncbi:MAG TPA: hypothetical protein VEC37_12680 [Bacillota bacterium]|nr:hypothetical protein [Bacillota bacterium]